MKKFLEPTVIFAIFAAALYMAGHNYFRHHFISVGIPLTLFTPPYDEQLSKGMLVLWSGGMYSWQILVITLSLIALVILPYTTEQSAEEWVQQKLGISHKWLSHAGHLRILLLCILSFTVVTFIQYKAQAESQTVSECFSRDRVFDDQGRYICKFYPIVSVQHRVATESVQFLGRWVYHNNGYSAFIQCKVDSKANVVVLKTDNIDAITRSADASSRTADERLNCNIDLIEYELSHQVKKS